MTKTTAPMTPEIRNDVWARGCEYVFEHYEDDGELHVVVVTCWGKKDDMVWSASTMWTDGDRILDVIRMARANAEVAKADGY